MSAGADSVEGLLRSLQPAVLSALLRRRRELQACEDALQEALVVAAARWPLEGVPVDPRAWLIRVAHRKLVDDRRGDTARRQREALVAGPVPRELQEALAVDEVVAAGPAALLELFLLCCHPSLSVSSAVALTLRAVGGLTTAEIARAYVVPEATMAQRLSRARASLAASAVALERPDAKAQRARLPAVLQVLYLVFNEGYAASSGPAVHRMDLAREGLRLTRVLHEAVPEEPEVAGLLALMLLTDARREARTGPAGELVPLDEQDRARWDREAIAEGTALVTQAFGRGAVGPYQLQAAIAALHDEASSTEATDWAQIHALYGVLLRMTDNPLVALNQVVATAMLEGPAAGLERLETLGRDPRLARHHRLESVRGHLLERAGRLAEARASYALAAARTASKAERDHLLLRAARLGLREGDR